MLNTPQTTPQPPSDASAQTPGITIKTQKFYIKTAAFEGPLDLLLTLIEKRKLLINDIALAKVTDDYITHVGQFEQFPISDSANFILIASTLLLIKSKSLLPSLPLTEEEQGSIEDLEFRLKLYKRIKELSIGVQQRFGKQIIFSRQESRIAAPVFSPEPDLKSAENAPGQAATTLLAALREVIKNLPQHEILPKAIVRQVISLEEMIESLTVRIKSGLRMSFREFARIGKEEKVNIIVSFLAMLELVKQGVINVAQESRFRDIQMETEQIGVPKY
jgi:segregation and condensation protein A